MRAKDFGAVAVAVLSLGVVAVVPLALSGGRWLSLVVLAVALGFVFFRVWGEQRIYLALRREVSGFHRLVQQLNTVALERNRSDSPETRRRLEEVRASMIESVDRMIEVAGKREIDLEAEGDPSGLPG
ncbi:MAG: hypothetical protein KY464_11535 [Gemmatimonadetes bacterium]|nr:hypothetical protein [Gemmatimonadota bacterium]